MDFPPRRGGSSSSAAGNTREELLAKAKTEREARQSASRKLKAEKLLRSWVLRRKVQNEVRADLASKVSQIGILAAAIKTAKGLDFIPPAVSLAQLLAAASWIARGKRALSKSDAAAITSLAAWVIRSVASPQAATNVLCLKPSVGHLKALLRACVIIICSKATPPDVREVALDCVAAQCGGAAADPSCLLLGSAAPSAGGRTVLPDAASAMLSLRSFVLKDLYFMVVARRCCAQLPTDQAMSSVLASQADKAIASKAVTTALYLALTAGADTAFLVSCGAAGLKALPPGPASTSACADFVAAVLSLPFLMARIAGTPAASALTQPLIFERLIIAHRACEKRLLSPPPLQQDTRVKDASAATVDAIVSAWPVEAYLLGNIAQLLTDTVSSQPLVGLSAASPSGLTVSPTPAGRGAPQHLLASQLSVSTCAAAINLVCGLMRALPDNTWTVSTPMLWVPQPSLQQQHRPASIASSSSSSSQQQMMPALMPPLLVSQLRRLSSERLANAVARICVDMRPGKLHNSRLRLPPEEDPERGSYNEYALDSLLLPASVTGSHLSSNVSLPTAVVRGMWEGSKLALSWLKRKATGADDKATPTTSAALKGPSYLSGTSPATGAVASFGSASTSSPLSVGAAAGATMNEPFDDDAVFAFCRLYAALVAPTPRPTSSASVSRADSEPIIGRMYLLNALAFSPSLSLPSKLWSFLVDRVDLQAFVVRGAFKSRCGLLDSSPSGQAFPAITLLCCLLGHLTSVMDDFELYGLPGGGDNSYTASLPLRELRHVIRLVRDVVVHCEGIGVDTFAVPEAAPALAAPATPDYPRFASAAISLLRALHERHSLRALGPNEMFLVDVSKLQVARRGGGLGGADAKEEALQCLLAVMPFCVPFETRVERYSAIRQAELQAAQVGNPQVPVRVYRSNLFDSAYAGLANVRGDALRRKVAVRFISAAGHEEIGIDAGGLFKELWTELAKIVFDASYGLFKTTAAGDLYPNPASALCSGLPEEQSFEFVGRLAGKALFEGITLGPRFARFWLHKLLGRPAGLHHLPSLDPELYKSLMFLKTYDGDVEGDLCLSFTVPVSDVMTSDAGGGEEVELIPGGASIPVTSANRMRYIHLAADYRLNTAIDRQTTYFLRGLHNVIPPGWLAGFSAPELQVLMSGSTTGIDVEDLRRNTAYTAGYSSGDRVIKDFWSVVTSFSERDKAALLRFCTSCDRSPPLGFRQLQPRFTIQKAALRSDATDTLPTSSTCFHVLSLPPYASAKVLREKLLLAIHSGTGFELT